MNPRAVLARLRDLLRRKQLEASLEEDMQFHREELEALYLKRGYTPAEAALEARRELGNLTRIREAYHEQAGFPFFEELFRDLVQAFRSLLHRPLFSFGCVLILALGLSLLATVEGLGWAILLKPLNIPRSEELHLVASPRGEPVRLSRHTINRLESCYEPSKVLGLSGRFQPTIRHDSLPAKVAGGQLITGNGFQVLGVKPLLGRLLTTEDDLVGNPQPVLVVSESWARREFGSPEAALGSSLIVNTQSLTIVGILPESFSGLNPNGQIDLWFATALQSRLSFSSNANWVSSSDRPNDRDWNREERVSWMQAFVRIDASTKSEQVLQLVLRAYEPEGRDLALALGNPEQREEALHRRFALLSTPGGYSEFRDRFRSEHRLLLCFTGLLLAICCANLSGLLLVRSLSRQREIGLRLALGAKRWRLFILLSSEAVLLSLGGTVLGLVLTAWMLPLGARLLAPSQTLGNLSLQPGLIFGTAFVALLIALLSSLLPCFFLCRMSPQDTILGRLGLGPAPMRVGRALVALQLGLAAIFVALAFSLGNQLSQLLRTDPGFATTRVLYTRFDPTSNGYALPDQDALCKRLESALLPMPGVESVSFASDSLVSGSYSRSGLYPRGSDTLVKNDYFQHNIVTPGFFQTAGLHLLRGRDFSPGDLAAGPGVAVVSQAFARRLFGKEAVLGRQFGFDPEPTSADITIVGVVSDARLNGLKEDAPAIFFLPRAQWSNRIQLGEILVRLQPMGPEPRLELQKALANAEPGLVFSTWQDLDERLRNGMSESISGSRLAWFFAGAALTLAMAGSAVLSAFLVSQRSRELAIRIALGEQSNRLLRSVLVENLLLALLGVGLGLLLAFLLQSIPALSSRLPGTLNPWTAAAAASLCLLASLLAGWGPALRASRSDPLALLRSS